MMRLIDEQHLKTPFYGSRKMYTFLRNLGYCINRKRVRRLMRQMGLEAMDWYSRRVLSWRVSNTMDADFCVDALEEALNRYGAPEIFNSDQGSQFTSDAFTGVLKKHNVRISMDGKGCYRDNIFVERLWRSVKYECVYLKAFDNGAQLKQELKSYFQLYNSERPHQSLDDNTPDQMYFKQAA
ncbi:putative transposase [Endozoicomonas sp. NE40]|uniref:Transposase n=1 Tax=Endozoicomonas lisbonensis TaxID=3120522 RepID=A0ABV2SBD3_9GAMM